MPKGKSKTKAAPPKDNELIDEPQNPGGTSLESWKGPDGTKSPGFALHAPKPGLPTDADDAGRGGEKLA